MKKAQAEVQLLKDKNETLSKLLMHHPDTGLPLSHVLFQKIGKQVEGKSREPFALGIIRLDKGYQRIRHYRDRQKVLLYITAQRIKDLVGEECLFQSDRSDEFLVVLPNITKEVDVLPFFNKLNDRISEPHNGPIMDVTFGCHMGVALYPTHAETLEGLFHNAEIALGIYEKRQTKGCIYTHELGEAYVQRRELETVLSKAINGGLEGFHVVYQPIVDSDRTLKSCEALMRWDAPEYGPISPYKFIPMAEENGQINILGQWILYNALRQLRDWRKQYFPGMTVSVNVSAVQLEHMNYLENVGGVLEALGVGGDSLHIEVTESTLMENHGSSTAKLEALRDKGVKIMLDDFGTGYSSLSALYQLPVDILKIAKEFVDDITTVPRALEMVKAILHMAHSCGVETLAEGVETEEQFDVLVSEGCHYIQGYIMSPPLAASVFSDRFFKNHT